MSTPEVIIHRDASLLANAVAARLVTRLVDAVTAHGSASLVLTGGGIGTAVLTELAATPARDAVDWRHVDIWWGDERFEPSGDPERNETGARAALLDHVDVDPARVHPMAPSDNPEGDDPEAAADRYAAELARAATPEDHGPVPSFDIMLLGIGPEGHVASLFPGLPALYDERSVVAVRGAPKPPPDPDLADLPVHQRGQRGLDPGRGVGEGRRGLARALGRRRAQAGPGGGRARSPAHPVLAGHGGGGQGAGRDRPARRPLNNLFNKLTRGRCGRATGSSAGARRGADRSRSGTGGGGLAGGLAAGHRRGGGLAGHARLAGAGQAGRQARDRDGGEHVPVAEARGQRGDHDQQRAHDPRQQAEAAPAPPAQQHPAEADEQDAGQHRAPQVEDILVVDDEVRPRR